MEGERERGKGLERGDGREGAYHAVDLSDWSFEQAAMGAVRQGEGGGWRERGKGVGGGERGWEGACCGFVIGHSNRLQWGRSDKVRGGGGGGCLSLWTGICEM